jgi:integrase/recombinase XerD
MGLTKPRARAKTNGPRAKALSFSRAPETLGWWAERHYESMRARNFSEHTVRNHQKSLAVFLIWCEARALTSPSSVTRPMLERFQRYLYFLRNAQGRALTFGSQKQRLIAVKAFFKWLVRSRAIFSNPASELDLPRPEKRLPVVLTAEEMERVLAQPDVREPLGVRDRAIMETLYSTGIRRMEVAGLGLYDLDRDRRALFVRQGKGKKDRVVPIGERAVFWIERYERDVRPLFVVGDDEKKLFLSVTGGEMEPGAVSKRVRDYVTAAELGKSGACHLFRHTMATLMLEGGADVRYVQEMLGHASVESTQIYTHVSIKKLQEVHAATHPACAKAKTAATNDTKMSTEADVAALFSTLAREDDDTHEVP